MDKLTNETNALCPFCGSQPGEVITVCDTMIVYRCVLCGKLYSVSQYGSEPYDQLQRKAAEHFHRAAEYHNQVCNLKAMINNALSTDDPCDALNRLGEEYEAFKKEAL